MRIKKGKSPVMLRVFLNGEMANFGSTKIFVDKTLWNNTGSRLKGRTTEALSVNAALDSISTTPNSIFHKFENDETLSLDKIRSYFVGKPFFTPKNLTKHPFLADFSSKDKTRK